MSARGCCRDNCSPLLCWARTPFYVFRPKSVGKPWLILHDVSFFWIAFAVENIYKEASLKLTSDPHKNALVFSYPQSIAEGCTEFFSYIGKVEISFEDIFDNSDQGRFQVLVSSWPEEYVFPQAHHLSIGMDHAYSGPNTHSSATEDKLFQWLAHRIKKSFPNIRQMEIYSRYDDLLTIGPESLQSTEWNSGLFLSAFFREVRGTGSMPQPYIATNRNLASQNTPQFIFISHYGDCIDTELAQHFTKRSATTLQSLKIDGRSFGFIKGCVFHENGQLATYPRLKKLEITTRMDHSDSPTKVEANELTTPFPALEYLKLYPGRIFDDYALFQRCSNTLINLDIELDRKTVDILEKTNVFSGAKNSQLCHITLRIAFDSRITMSAVEFVKFAVGLSTPATRTLAINGDIPYQSIIRVIPTCPYAEKLQILDLREVNLSLSEMISIIKLVPIVADFSRTFRGIDPELNSQQGTSLPGYLYPYIYPLGHWLKCWYIYPTVAVSTRDIAISAITLTTLCPRFTCALLQGGDFGGIYRELCSGIDSGLYGEYAETIKKLFYIGV